MPLDDRADPEAGAKLLSKHRNGRARGVEHHVDDDADYGASYDAPDTG